MSQDERVCRWTEDGNGEGNWDTTCGESFVFIDEGPFENRVRFCCYCGKRIVAVPYVEPEAADEDREDR